MNEFKRVFIEVNRSNIRLRRICMSIDEIVALHVWWCVCHPRIMTASNNSSIYLSHDTILFHYNNMREGFAFMNEMGSFNVQRKIDV